MSDLNTVWFFTGAKVTAEGIENAAELECVQALGIHYGQGYFLGRPGPVDALARYRTGPKEGRLPADLSEPDDQVVRRART